MLFKYIQNSDFLIIKSVQPDVEELLNLEFTTFIYNTEFQRLYIGWFLVFKNDGKKFLVCFSFILKTVLSFLKKNLLCKRTARFELLKPKNDRRDRS